MVYAMYSTTADTELTPSATCQASATTLGRNRNLSLLSVPCMVLSKRGLLWVPPKWQAASSKCIRTYTQLLVCTASAPPIQDVGVLIRLFPTRFDLVPAPCSSLTQDVRTTGLKNQALYAADPFTVMAGAERGKKGNIFLVTVVEMQQIAGASKYFRVIN